jgi:GNAT superfamily N-acetyltransferase
MIENYANLGKQTVMIRIREATIKDKPDIVSFQLAMARETEDLILDPNVVSLGVAAIFDDPAKGTYYVAESEGKVIASLLTTYEWSDWRNGQILWIQSVYVLKPYRGKGTFRKLYESVKSMVLSYDNDFKGIRLYVDNTNHAAQGVYEKLGMEGNHYKTFEWMNS